MHDTHEAGMKNGSCVCGLSVEGEYLIRFISHSPSPEERYLSPPAGELHQAGRAALSLPHSPVPGVVAP